MEVGKENQCISHERGLPIRFGGKLEEWPLPLEPYHSVCPRFYPVLTSVRPPGIKRVGPLETLGDIKGSTMMQRYQPGSQEIWGNCPHSKATPLSH